MSVRTRRRRKGFGMRYLICALAILAIASSVAANDYFPMCPGSVWEYLGSETEEPYTTTCIGTEDFWGVECAAFSHSGPGDEGLVNYFFTGDEGHAVLRGFFRSYENWGMLYDPGIDIMSEDPYLGQQWCSTADWYDLPDYGYFGTYDYCLEIVEETDLVLPAGVISAFGVGYLPPPALASSFDVFGRAHPSVLSNAAYWYAYEVGTVQFLTADLYQIADYSLPPSGTEVASWSRIKTLYR